MLFLADCGTILRCIKASCSAINQLLFPFSDAKVFVASSSDQIKIYDFQSFVKRFEFTPKDAARIVAIKIIPNDERIFVVLHNNIICILTNALKLIRHFEPLKARHKYLQKVNQKIEKLNYVEQYHESDNDMEVDKLIKAVTRDYHNGIVMNVAFTPNGSSFCVCFADNSLMFCSSTMWDVRRVIKFPDFYIKQCDYITHNGEQNNSNMLLTATSNDDLMLISLKDLNSKMLIDMNNSSAFTVSSNGKILLNVQQSGEILVYNMDHCLSGIVDMNTNNCARTLAAENDRSCTKYANKDWDVELNRIQMKVISMFMSSTIPQTRTPQIK